MTDKTKIPKENPRWPSVIKVGQIFEELDAMTKKERDKYLLGEWKVSENE